MLSSSIFFSDSWFCMLLLYATLNLFSIEVFSLSSCPISWYRVFSLRLTSLLASSTLLSCPEICSSIDLIFCSFSSIFGVGSSMSTMWVFSWSIIGAIRSRSSLIGFFFALIIALNSSKDFPEIFFDSSINDLFVPATSSNVGSPTALISISLLSCHFKALK